MIKYRTNGKGSLIGKTVAISGAGNVAQHAAIKVLQLGGSVTSLSDSEGSVIATQDGAIDMGFLDKVISHKAQRRQLAEFVSDDDTGIKYVPGQRPWKNVPRVKIAPPCATQNERLKEAQVLINAGCKYVTEGSNMSCTSEASALLESHRKQKQGNATRYAPGKAANSISIPPYNPYSRIITSSCLYLTSLRSFLAIPRLCKLLESSGGLLCYRLWMYGY
ncbi:NADP-specific glutamate dehydrogenase [Penicillium hordei]|uniref:NADP-specific glutamate dehydrogenase n=1 Tax=Penicillium hordei TaxID=40994 RepID=A0AAD6DVL8_9EURO|nr:NADP-specific glutamate dehydrogenase [Penicillium hordei]KAJ5593680.1 NADP-specific glutamate dehydrogenase [Penicillium hordei]